MSEAEKYSRWVESVMSVDSSVSELIREGEQCGMEPEKCINEVLNKLYDHIRDKDDLQSCIILWLKDSLK